MHIIPAKQLRNRKPPQCLVLVIRRHHRIRAHQAEAVRQHDVMRAHARFPGKIILIEMLIHP